MRHLALFLTLCAGLLGQGVIQYAPKVPPGYPSYQPSVPVEGTIQSIGADSFSDVWEEWRQGFLSFHPQVQFQITHAPVSRAIKAFTDEGMPLIHVPRELKQEEFDAFQKKHGYPPTKLVVCFDAFIVFVHAQNPIKHMDLDQLDAAYSTTKLAGYKPGVPTETWSDLGVSGSLGRMPINAYMRAEGLASRTTIQDLVLLKGKFKPTVKVGANWNAIAEAVMGDPAGLGIGTLASWLTRNKTLALTPLGSKDPVPPNQENVVTGKYPLSRTYYLYVDRAPGQNLPPALAEFLQFILSQEGQAAVTQASIYPLPLELAQMNRKRLRGN